ncbi:MAG: hypothetical protein MJ158_04380, partial [Alphaproteobacteria bacterium]|nr:hypothetical protein [Alphaproteobacteria bacterium]
YYDGFIDLLFVRIVGGKPIYSILDWKTDYLQTDDYIDKYAVKKQVDDKYSIQRVLYSYCLIKWLKQFNEYKNMTEHDIFENHFGGIYYVLLRGCVENTGNGIYAHTWLCWEDLEDAFNNIVKEKVRK